MTPLEKAMVEYFEAEDTAGLDWVNSDRTYEEHGKYLLCMYYGLTKDEAYYWMQERDLAKDLS